MNYQHRIALYTKVTKHSYLHPCTHNCFRVSTPGAESNIHMVKEVLFWPGMGSAIHDMYQA